MAVWTPRVPEAILRRLDDGVPLPIPRELGAGLAAVAFLLGVVPIVGRVFLAWLPPGLPGRHAPRDLPATWAASHLVGLTWFLALREFELHAAWPYVAFGVPAVALIARLVTSPAGLVPRHDPVTSAAWPALLSALTVLVGIGAPLVARPGSSANPIAIANTTAALVLLLHGLQLARSPVRVRVAFCMVVAPFLVLTNDLGDVWTGELLVLPAAAVAAGTVGWLRRADERALALTAVGIAFLATLWSFGVPAAACVSAVVTLATARRVRVRAAVWCGLAVCIGFAVRPDSPVLDPSVSAGPLDGVRWFHFWAVPWFLLVTATFPFWIGAGWLADRRARARWNPSGAPRGREAATLLAAATAAWIPAAVAQFGTPAETLLPFPIFESWTLVAFVAGLGLSSWLAGGAEDT